MVKDLSREEPAEKEQKFLDAFTDYTGLSGDEKVVVDDFRGRVSAALDGEDNGLAKLKTTKAVNVLNTLADAVDMIPAFGLDDGAAAVIKAIAATVQTGEAIMRGDKELAMKAGLAGTIRTGVAALPFVEYLKVLDVVVGGVKGQDVNLSAEEIAAKLVDGITGKVKDNRDFSGKADEEPSIGGYSNIESRGHTISHH
ncbi:MAG: hypothetical protein COV36_00855 [Alphaproteobacteria bacterium CG11_big_fil_rev_8_21_14_0_20_44_7]|nr:MAG: hypothetical protein COV36_00855 [Alphaproteobacteria bacterium CG11_big_fil_rev_8_21_14_0_20_44_7]